MALTFDQVCERIDNMHIDDLDITITRDGPGFVVTEVRGGPYVSDIGGCYEAPDSADEHGRVRFTAGPWDAYQYHASYVSPHRDNYLPMLVDLAAGRITAVVCGYGALDDTWVFGIRAA
ncbi:MAG: hypothetical protein WAV90_19250 [Gordonia amarae]